MTNFPIVRLQLFVQFQMLPGFKKFENHYFKIKNKKLQYIKSVRKKEKK